MGCIQRKRNPYITIQKLPEGNTENAQVHNNNIIKSNLILKVKSNDRSMHSNQDSFAKNKETTIQPKKKDKIENYDFLRKILSQHFLFKEISPKTITDLLDHFITKEIDGGKTIYKEHELLSYYYIIKHGKVGLYSKGKKLEGFGSKESFGELALLKHEKSSRTAICESKVVLFSLSGAIFREIVLKLNESELKERLEFITIVPLFKQISSIEINSIASSLYKCEFEMNETIIQEGNSGDSLFIISKGEVKCLKDNKVIRELRDKDYFGEYALLFDMKRSLTIKASSNKVICYQLCKNVLQNILGDHYKAILFTAILKEALEKSQNLYMLAKNNYLDQIFAISSLKTYKEGDIIFSSATETAGKRIFVLIEGNLIDNQKKINLASRGELFGDEYLSMKSKCNNDSITSITTTTIIAQNECRILQFEWEKVVTMLNLGVENDKALSVLNKLEHLKQLPLCKDSSLEKLIEICKILQKETYAANSIIFREGDNGDKLYLIKKGKVEVMNKSKIIRQLEDGNCFGELALIINKPRSATIKAITDVVVYTLNKENFYKIIDKHMLAYLTYKISLQDNFQLALKDLYYCRPLGEGKFGSVALVHDKKNLYAIKAVNRSITEKQRLLIKYFVAEKKVLLELDHPFIMKLVKTFKNEDYLFYLMEFIDGKRFDYYLDNKISNINSIPTTQFYLGSLFIIIDYLNNKSVCHRDLKPENLMIDDKGFLKVIDFGCSIKLKDFTFTSTGTPHYMAPEILSSKGYSYSCDYWSIGVIAYEMIYGCFPFGNKATNPLEVYKDILSKTLVFPTHENKLINSIISKLLNKRVTERLCTLNAVKNEAFFKNFQWHELIDLSMPTPIKSDPLILKQLSEYDESYLNTLKTLKNNNQLEYSSSSKISEECSESEIPPNWIEEF